mmetsp:Transcript_77101/g.249534  ORF Transcript_77101/g.249534 Transcript_77101/m.249534 type:complete len:310 (+) Transcript_77101:126-1055(+)
MPTSPGCWRLANRPRSSAALRSRPAAFTKPCGVRPCASAALRSAPPAARAASTVMCPQAAAQCAGVRSRRSRRSTRAPSVSNAQMSSRLPSPAARCNATAPPSSVASSSKSPRCQRAASVAAFTSGWFWKHCRTCASSVERAWRLAATLGSSPKRSISATPMARRVAWQPTASRSLPRARRRRGPPVAAYSPRAVLARAPRPAPASAWLTPGAQCSSRKSSKPACTAAGPCKPPTPRPRAQAAASRAPTNFSRLVSAKSCWYSRETSCSTRFALPKSRVSTSSCHASATSRSWWISFMSFHTTWSPAVL